MLFISRKYKNLRIVTSPTRKMVVDSQLVTMPGKTIEFSDYKFETNDTEVIEALKKSKSYGVWFYPADGESVITPNPDGAREEKSRQEAAEEIGSICPDCGFKAKTAQGLEMHMRVHNKDS